MHACAADARGVAGPCALSHLGLLRRVQDGALLLLVDARMAVLAGARTPALVVRACFILQRRQQVLLVRMHSVHCGARVLQPVQYANRCASCCRCGRLAIRRGLWVIRLSVCFCSAERGLCRPGSRRMRSIVPCGSCVTPVHGMCMHVFMPCDARVVLLSCAICMRATCL